MAALATLPDGDRLSFKRLQDMIELTPGNLITHLRKLEEAGCAEISISVEADNEAAQKLYLDAGLTEASVYLEKHIEK